MNTSVKILVALAALGVSRAALADGGYFPGTKGARAAGRGGAFAVKADDAMAVAFNPAGLARLRGTHAQAGNRFSYQYQFYERQSTLDWGTTGGIPRFIEFAPVENEKPWFLLDPLIGVTSDLGLDNWGFALVVYAPPGAREQQFPIDGGQRYQMVSRKSEVINYTASAAWKYKDLFGIGASLQWIYLRALEYQLVIDANPSVKEANPVRAQYDLLSTVSGSDPFTLNAYIGAWYRAAPFLEFGVSGQVIPTSWEVDGTLNIDPINTAEEVSLTRNGQPADDVTLSLPLPISARAGVRYIGLQGDQETFDVEFDVVYETWSRVDTFTLDSKGMSASLQGTEIPIGVVEIEKYWNDTLGFHLGGDYAVLPGALVARAGGYYETAVAEPAYPAVDFPSGPFVGGTLGGSVFLSNLEIALGYEYRHQLERRVQEGDGRVYQELPGCPPPYNDANQCHPEFLGQPSPAVNGGRYRAHSHSLSVDLRYRF